MKNYVWIIAVIAIVGLYLLFNKGGMPSSDTATLSISPAPTQSTVKAPAGSKPKPAASNASAPQTAYTDLVKQYGDRRLQFDAGCQVSPNTMTYRNGTSIMLDNRSDVAKTVKIGSAQYNLGAKGYMIVLLNSTSLPKDLAISCNNSPNVGKILLQALISN